VTSADVRLSVGKKYLEDTQDKNYLRNEKSSVECLILLEAAQMGIDVMPVYNSYVPNNFLEEPRVP
jgi:hypothetical protein